jgi:hypothetical protein
MTPEQRELLAEKRKKAAETLVQCLRDPGILTIIYDEITFSQFDSPKYFFRFEGQDLEKDYEAKDNKKRTAIAAVSSDLEVYYMLHDGATDSNLVLTFLTEILNKRGNEGYKTIALFGDNASWHGDMVEVHLCSGVLWLKNAKASPTLSPIEVIFGFVKKNFKVFNRMN